MQKIFSNKVWSRLMTASALGSRRLATSRAALGSTDSGRAYFMLIVPAGAFCLGTWQVYRREWKLGLIKSLEERTSAPPVPLPENLEDLEGMDYHRFELVGHFDNSKEVFIGPRSLVAKDDGKTVSTGMFSTGQSGFNIVTPFRISDSNLTVLVNRGWVPRKKMERNTRLSGQLEDETRIIGLYRSTEPRPPFVPKNLPKSNVYHFRDVDSIAQILDTAPIFFDADSTCDVPGGPIGGQTVVTLRNEHLSYMATWYLLALITSYLWYRKYIKKLPFS